MAKLGRRIMSSICHPRKHVKLASGYVVTLTTDEGMSIIAFLGVLGMWSSISSVIVLRLEPTE